MIEPREVYHWLGSNAMDAILESYEIPPEASCGLVIEEPDHDE